MKAKYIIIHGNKKDARREFLEGWFFTWTDENLCNAFSFGRGTIQDFKDNINLNTGNMTALYIDSLKYIDSDKKSDITRDDLEAVFFKYGISI